MIRLADTEWFNQLQEVIAQSMVRSHDLVADNPFAHFSVAIGSVGVEETHVGSAELLRGIIRLHTIVHRTGALRWCKYGFLHEVESPSTTHAVKHDRISTTVLPILNQFDFALHHPDEASNASDRDIGRALHWLAYQIDEAAFLADRALHVEDADDDFRVVEHNWLSRGKEAAATTADIHAKMVMNVSLNALWELAEDERVEESLPDGVEATCRSLKKHSADITDIACEIPFLFDVLKPRSAVQKGIQFVRDWSEAVRLEQWERLSEYDANPLVVMATNRFRIALAAWCIAVRIWDEKTQSA